MTDGMTDAKQPVLCPHCRSRKTVKNGRHASTHTQKILCRNCGKSCRTTYRYQAYKMSPRLERRLQTPIWSRGISACVRPRPEVSRTGYRAIGPGRGQSLCVAPSPPPPARCGLSFCHWGSGGTSACGCRDCGETRSQTFGRWAYRGSDPLLYRWDEKCSFHAVCYCRRAAFALGYKRVITYTLASESGVTLKAAGWQCAGLTGGGSWHAPSRPRKDKHPLQPKRRWETRVV